MNRNFVIGIVLFGLVLAGLSVGISTFMASRELQGTADEMVSKSGGQADGLVVTDQLWAKGTLTVTDPEADSNAIFLVSYEDSGSVQVGTSLSVAGSAAMSDVWAKGVVGARSFQNDDESWVVSPKGDMRAGAVVADKLKLAGDFEAGDGAVRFIARDNGQSDLIVVGRVMAGTFESGDDERIKFASGIGSGGSSGSSGWNISTGGDASFNKVTASNLVATNATITNLTAGVINADDVNSDRVDTAVLNAPGSEWWVTAAGDGSFEDLFVNSLSSATSVKAGTTVSADTGFLLGDGTNFSVDAAGVIRGTGLDVGAGTVNANSVRSHGITVRDVGDTTTVFGVDSVGNTDIAGALTVANAAYADSFALRNGSFAVGTGGSVITSGTLTVAGASTFNSNVTVNADKTVVGTETVTGNLYVGGTIHGSVESTTSQSNTLIARNFLYVGNGPGTWVFEVDNSGNTTIDGTLTVNANATFDSFALSSGDFTVGTTGNTAVNGTLAVNNTATANAFANSGGSFGVTSGGAITGTSLNVGAGAVSAGSGTFTGNVQTANLRATNEVLAGSFLRVGPVGGPYVFQVDNSGNTSVGGTLAVAGNATFSGNVAVTGNVTAANLPSTYAAGTATVSGGTVNVAVTGLLAGDSVVVTPRFDPAGSDFWVVPAAGQFTINGPDGAYSYMVLR